MKMIKKFYTLLLLLFASSNVFYAQDVIWEKRYNNSDRVETAYAIAEAPNNNFIIAGSSTYGYGAGNSPALEAKMYIVRIDSSGAKINEKLIGKSGYKFCYAYAVGVGSDGSVYVAGAARTDFNTNWDVYVLKLSANLQTVIWERIVGGSGSEWAYSLALNEASNQVVVAGTTTSNQSGASINNYQGFALPLLLNNGSNAWTSASIWGNSNSNEVIKAVRKTSDGFIFAGTTIANTDNGESDVYLLKTSNNLQVTWTKTFNVEKDDITGGISLLPSGGYTVVGYSSLGPNRFKSFLLRTDTNGNLLSNGGKVQYPEGRDALNSIQTLTDGSFIMAGSTSVDKEVGQYYTYLMKTTTSGVKSTDLKIGGSPNSAAHALIISSDGSIIVVGRDLKGIPEQNLARNDHFYVAKVALCNRAGAYDQEIDLDWPNAGPEMPVICNVYVRQPDGNLIYQGRTNSDGKLVLRCIKKDDVIEITTSRYMLPVFTQGKRTITATQPNQNPIVILLSPFVNPPGY